MGPKLVQGENRKERVVPDSSGQAREGQARVAEILENVERRISIRGSWRPELYGEP